MKIRCPHCHSAIELIDDSPLSAVSCPSCGSNFNLLTDVETISHARSQEKTIAHFQLIEQVGVGASGSVWKATDNQLGRQVAMKLPRKEQLTETEAEQFLREARSAAQLKHSGIVAVHEVGRENGQVYIISDFVEGVSLASMLTAGRPSIREAAKICRQVAEALHHAHEMGVIHRDLKPANIMLDAHSQPLITDFGLAKREAGEITMTLEGQVLGTPAYMPPEQARGEGHRADRRSDVYSLGAVLFELLTGERPFRGEARMLLHQVIHEDAPSPRKLNANIPKDLETICLKCLRKEPEKRYQSAAELAADLSRWQDDRPILARPASRWEHAWRWCRRNPAVAGLLTLSAMLLIGIGVTGALALDQVARREAAEVARIEEAKENDRKRARSLMEAVLTAPAQAVPYAIQNLEPLKEYAIPILEQHLNDGETNPSQRLHAACALSAFGRVDVEAVVSLIENSHDDEFSNILRALEPSQQLALEKLREIIELADRAENWNLKSRLATIALWLGDQQPASDMAALAPDPVQRTTLIHTVPHWHGDLCVLARFCQDLDDGALRSAICLSVGGISLDDISAAEQAAWKPLLRGWFQMADDAGTHGAADWALRQWKVTLPKIEPITHPAENATWFVNGVGMTMIRIPAGQFRMGSNSEQANFTEKPVHEVKLTRPFYLSDREVTAAQFLEYMNDPSSEKFRDWTDGGLNRHIRSLTEELESYPMESVSGFDAVLFCNWLSQREGLTPCYERTGQKETFLTGPKGTEYDEWDVDLDANGYRLPTEAEWEYGCRGETITEFCFGDSESLLPQYGVFGATRSKRCGTKHPNAWGLFDMHGNLAEWCWDRFGPYPGEVTDISAQIPRGGFSIVRGGNWHQGGEYCRSATRQTSFFFNRSGGFRVVVGPFAN